MPVQKGFKGNAPFLEGIVRYSHRIEVVPLALASKRQTNPIYSMPPGGHGSVQLAENITTNVIANQFGVAEAFGRLFVYARTELPHLSEPAYINIWSRKLSNMAPQGRKARRIRMPSQCIIDDWSEGAGGDTGVFYCTVSVRWMSSDDPLWGECLCGKSCNRWAGRGWVCPFVQVADW